MDPRLAQAIEIISTNLQRRVSLPELATRVGLGPRRLELLFKSGTGLPFVSYYRKLRMERACDFLQASAKPVKEIAADLGYKAPEVFCRDFKMSQGATPTQFAAMRKKSVDFVIHQLNSLDNYPVR